MVAVRELIAAIFWVSPCVRKELPVAGGGDIKKCKPHLLAVDSED